MGKKIKISESQLQMILKTKNLKEQDDMDSIRDEMNSIQKFMNNNHKGFENIDELLSSIYDRVVNSLHTQDWGIIREIRNDIKSFYESHQKEDVDNEISNEMPEETNIVDKINDDESPLNEGVEKLKNEFKRFLT